MKACRFLHKGKCTYPSPYCKLISCFIVSTVPFQISAVNMTQLNHLLLSLAFSRGRVKACPLLICCPLFTLVNLIINKFY